MMITSKGQVTIPGPIRKKMGFFPHTHVAFHVRGTQVILVKETKKSTRGGELVRRLQGTATSGMSTEDIMRLTRGES